MLAFIFHPIFINNNDLTVGYMYQYILISVFINQTLKGS